MFYEFAWEDLVEIRDMSMEEVLAWLETHGEDDDYELDEKDDDHVDFHLGGFYADEHLVVVFEFGKVVRWYRSECFA